MFVRNFKIVLTEVLGCSVMSFCLCEAGRFKAFKTKKASASFVQNVIGEGRHILYIDLDSVVYVESFLDIIFRDARYGLFVRKPDCELGEDIFFYVAKDDEDLKQHEEFHKENLVACFNREDFSYHFYKNGQKVECES